MNVETQWYVALNPQASQMFAELLSASGEGSGRENHRLIVDDVSYRCWMIESDEINPLREMRDEKPEVFSKVRFIKRVGSRDPEFADFFEKKSANKVKKTFTGEALAAQQLAKEITRGRGPAMIHARKK